MPASFESVEDWAEIQERLLANDRLAFLRVQRLITNCLAQLRAYDFRDEWDDLRQEVMEAVVANGRGGRLRDPRAFVGYVRITTRNKFIDRLKRQVRQRERERLPWDEETARAAAAQIASGDDRSLAGEVWALVDGLPEEQRRVIEEVYRRGRTYQQVSEATGLPLGTMKRRLRQALAALRVRAAAAFQDA